MFELVRSRRRACFCSRYEFLPIFIQNFMKLFLLTLFGYFSATALFASDHIDGPVTTKHAVSDLTDFFVFPSPSTPGHWTLVLNLYPLAREESHFSSKVEYSFILREAEIVPDGAQKLKVRINSTDEKIITCRFVTPHDHVSHTATCDAGNGMKRTVELNAIDTKPDSSGLLFFHGRRSDPFFFNSDWALELISKGKISPPAKSNTMSDTNILSLVVELDLNALFGKNVSLVALAAQSVSVDEVSGQRKQLDRIGRPEVTNIILPARKGEPELRDSYNQESPFQVKQAHEAAYRGRMTRNLAFYDMSDGTADWSDEQRAAYVEMLLDDCLLINAAKSSSRTKTQGYFSIETDVLNGIRSDAPGGRALTDDFMDQLYTYMINRNTGRTISDGVSAPSSAVSDAFPYLAAPDTGIMGWIKAKIGRLFTGSR
ncbi:MAG: hypothetical protein B7Z37_15630 [Verrucomicrobia bacterium 12-59-8]|nr:MAG: hypothetical protein B7Z37_15630 [Verrucomicrobia bacterium 12-59-8]